MLLPAPDADEVMGEAVFGGRVTRRDGVVGESDGAPDADTCFSAR